MKATKGSAVGVKAASLPLLAPPRCVIAQHKRMDGTTVDWRDRVASKHIARSKARTIACTGVCLQAFCLQLVVGLAAAAIGGQQTAGPSRTTPDLRSFPFSATKLASPSTMGDADAQERKDELEALAAIFGDDFQLLGEDTFELSVQVGTGHELSLHCALPATYPSESPPVYDLRASWLHPADEATLNAGLESISLESHGDVIIFKWVEWLRDEAASLLSHPPSKPDPPSPSADECAAAVAALEVEDACENDAMLAKLADDGLESVGITRVQEAHADLHGAVRTGPCARTIIQIWEQAIRHGEPFVDRKSTFQAHLGAVRSQEEVHDMLQVLKSNNKIARATHNIMAYRLTTAEGNALADCDDDGENAAGGRLLHLLDIVSASNVCVVVSRWYGGIQLGPDRFKHINNVARQLLVEHGYAGGEGGAASPAKAGKGSKKGK